MDTYFDKERRIFVAVIPTERLQLERAGWAMFTHGVLTNLTQERSLGFHAIAIPEEHLPEPTLPDALQERLEQAIRRLTDTPHARELVAHLKNEREQILTQWLLNAPKE